MKLMILTMMLMAITMLAFTGCGPRSSGSGSMATAAKTVDRAGWQLTQVDSGSMRFTDPVMLMEPVSYGYAERLTPSVTRAVWITPALPVAPARKIDHVPI